MRLESRYSSTSAEPMKPHQDHNPAKGASISLEGILLVVAELVLTGEHSPESAANFAGGSCPLSGFFKDRLHLP